MISLNKLSIRDFKIFGSEPYTIDFAENRLVLLDGPNGYGKTSVFDAIELAITGNISRLISLDGRQNPKDIVVAHKGDGETEITIEFIDPRGETKIFQRKLKSEIPKSSKKISKFPELWEIYEAIDGSLVPSTQEALDSYFDCDDFKRDFLLFHYVQQEETSRFLKTKNETQRAEELAQLFGNTREADEKLKKLKSIYSLINTAKKRNIDRAEEIKRLYKLDNTVEIRSEGVEPHFYVLPWLAQENKSPFWDSPTVTELNQDRLNSSLMELTNIKNLIRHKHFYIKNRRFENAISQREVLEHYLGYYNSIEHYELYKSRKIEYEFVKNSLATLRHGDLVRIAQINNLERLFETLDHGSCSDFKRALTLLAKDEKDASGLSSIYVELIKHHESLAAELKNTPTETSCLLCGQDYHSHNALSEAISQHGHLLRGELSNKEKSLVSSRREFKNTHLSPLIEACNKYLDRTNAPSQSDLLSLSKALGLKERFAKLQGWLASEGITHEDLLATSFPLDGNQYNVSEAADHLCKRIHSTVGAAPDGFYEDNGSNVFDRIYRDYFNNQIKCLEQVDITQLDSKSDYIKSIYFSSLKDISEELSKITKQMELLKRATQDVAELITVLTNKIKQYRKKLITDIEIPFYIYSGKILQFHQAGLGHGIFVKDPTGGDELKNVRLVSNFESDHDVLNTMSSGQISAVVIALTLALHRVYATRFSTIFIDDPVQTMDDINMSSLVEVLRNDFQGKQIVLSTHEDKVARYFTYKYLKHSNNVKIVNLMKRKEFVPINKFIYSSDTRK